MFSYYCAVAPCHSYAVLKSVYIISSGRGTSAMEGLSIAWAVMEHLHDVISRVYCIVIYVCMHLRTYVCMYICTY